MMLLLKHNNDDVDNYWFYLSLDTVGFVQKHTLIGRFLYFWRQHIIFKNINKSGPYVFVTIQDTISFKTCQLVQSTDQ